MVAPGGCDRSDYFLPYVAYGMLFLRTAEPLLSMSETRSLECSEDDLRRIRDTSFFLYRAIRYSNRLLGLNTEEVTLGEQEKDTEAYELLRKNGSEVRIPGGVDSLVVRNADNTRGTLNAILAGQLPTQRELWSAKAYCASLGQCCHNLSVSRRSGCY